MEGEEEGEREIERNGGREREEWREGGREGERGREREREGEGGRERERERESDRVFLKCCGCYVIRKKKERKKAQKSVANIKQMRLFF